MMEQETKRMKSEANSEPMTSRQKNLTDTEMSGRPGKNSAGGDALQEQCVDGEGNENPSSKTEPLAGGTASSDANDCPDGAIEVSELIVSRKVSRHDLESYRCKREEIRELKYKLEHSVEEAIGNDVVFDYRSGYPRPQTVVGVDEVALYRRQARFKTNLAKLEFQCEVVEEFIESIPDSRTRRMFRMVFIDGESYSLVARKIHMDRKNVSRSIDKYLQKSAEMRKNRPVTPNDTLATHLST